MTEAKSITDMSTRLLKIGEVARILGLGRTKVYDLVLSGELGSVKISRARRVPSTELSKYMKSLRPQIPSCTDSQDE